MQPKTLFKFVSLLAAMALFMAGCGTSAPAPATQSGTAAGDVAITIVIPEDPPSFNPSVGDTGYDALVLNLVMLGLTGIDPTGSFTRNWPLNCRLSKMAPSRLMKLPKQ